MDRHVPVLVWAPEAQLNLRVHLKRCHTERQNILLIFGGPASARATNDGHLLKSHKGLIADDESSLKYGQLFVTLGIEQFTLNYTCQSLATMWLLSAHT